MHNKIFALISSVILSHIQHKPLLWSKLSALFSDDLQFYRWLPKSKKLLLDWAMLSLSPPPAVISCPNSAPCACCCTKSSKKPKLKLAGMILVLACYLIWWESYVKSPKSSAQPPTALGHVLKKHFRSICPPHLFQCSICVWYVWVENYKTKCCCPQLRDLQHPSRGFQLNNVIMCCAKSGGCSVSSVRIVW